MPSLFRRKPLSAFTAADQEGESGGLHRNLSLFDLTAFGIAAIVGAGIFSTIGNAAASGGPAVTLLFLGTAVACGLSAMCYAEFASRIPLAGSAYTYAYASFGELIAWIIGWDLLMEYAIGNIVVAISWSEYFTNLCSHVFGWDVPGWLCTGYGHCANQVAAAQEALAQGQSLTKGMQDALALWDSAPRIGNMRILMDIPAFLITALITWLIFIGVRESKRASNAMVILKLAIVLFVVLVGAQYVQTGNWSPFAPEGLGGVLKGVSGVFFAYIGFDAISTTAEECKNPQRDLPRGMFLSLIICTVLYIVISLVLTGMVPYRELRVEDPLAYVFDHYHLNVLAGIVAAGAVVAMASVLLVFQLGQPRIWMSMSRDGLLPPIFAKVHKKYRTPGFSTLLTGIIVGVPALFLDQELVTDLTSIGTLFAFVLVCGGVLRLEETGREPGRYKVPYFPSRNWLPPIYAVGIALLIWQNGDGLSRFFDWSANTGWQTQEEKIPLCLFIGMAIWLFVRSVRRNLSLIPVLGLLANLYLMTELGWTNWLRFVIWLAIGLIIYFGYSYRNSKLHHVSE